MAVRLIQIVTPDVGIDDVRDVLDDKLLVGIWDQQLTDKQVLTAALVRSEDTQETLDILKDKFGDCDGFRVVVQNVEATLPHPHDEDSEVDEESDSDDDGPPISREELLTTLGDGAKLGPMFLATTVLSSIVAAFGLIRDDVAMIIGAMVIAPLLIPNVALALGCILGDLKLVRRSLVTNIVGVSIAFAITVLLGLLVPFSPDATQIASRTDFALGVVVVALASGSAGALSVTTGIPSSLIGVMVAVALLPPLAAAGLLLGAGEFEMSSRAMLLVIVNVTCINLAGVLTFLVQGIRPGAWHKEKVAKKAVVVSIASSAIMLALLVVLILVLSKDKT